MHRHERGFSILETLTTVAIVGILGLVTVPAFATYRRHASVIDAANQLKSIFRLVQSRAIAHNANCGVKFAPSGPEWTYALHDDGDHDGIRNDDIDRGIDRCFAPRRPVFPESRLAKIALPRVLSIKDPDGDTLTASSSPVQFGRSTICSFSHLGESTPGTIYLTDSAGELWCVRVYGATGRVRLLRYNAGKRKWESR